MTEKPEEEVWDLDADSESADWTKKTWDLPPYGSTEFFQIVPIESLDEFKKGVAYRSAVEQGLIHDDQWVADFVK